MKPFVTPQRYFWPLLLVLVAPVTAGAQTSGVGIGTTTPAASAALDVSSTTQGVLLPRLSLVQRQALGTGTIAAPVPGLVIYQTDNTPGLYAYDGTAWVRLGADNLGNHTATENLKLGTNQLVGNGGSKGLSVSNDGRIGVGTATATPAGQLANTATNIIGSDGYGVNSASLVWASPVYGYAGAFYNDATIPGANGLAVKVASAAATGAVLDLSQGTQGGIGTSLLRVRGDGNVGIGTASPAARLDVNGNTRLTGTLQLNTADADKIFLTTQGASGSKIGHATGWGVLNYAGPGNSSTTGYHSWLTTTGNDYAEQMRLTTAGLGIGTATPRGKLDVDGGGDTYLVDDPNSGSTQSVFLPGHLFLAPYSSSSGTAYVQARVPNPTSSTNIGLTLRTTNAGYLVEALALAPNGNATLSGNLDVAGSVGLGITTVYQDYVMPPNSFGGIPIACPAGTQLLSGGGGIPAYATDQLNVVLNYSGPDPGSPTTIWRINISNGNASPRNIRVYCNCARIR